tara:strand:- start:26 stop:136 length:111 start_codon:yes stop_codon:yes gene_type:complete
MTTIIASKNVIIVDGSFISTNGLTPNKFDISIQRTE